MSKLYPHQQETVDTIKKSEKNKTKKLVNGYIVAFKMGLGKTRTMLDLMHSDLDPLIPNLVICNKSNVQVWKQEIEKTKKEYPDFKYYIYHKDYNKEQPLMGVYNIIITTYETITKNFKLANPKCAKIKLNNYLEALPATYNIFSLPKTVKIVEIVKTQGYNSNIIYGTTFNRIICDESQRIASHTSLISKAVIALRARHYYCLSGTPIMNWGPDLYPQFKFMGINLEAKFFTKKFYKEYNLESYIITKDFPDTDIKLPEVSVVDISISFSDIEKKMYNAVINMLREKYAQFQKGNETFAAPLAMLMRLRQICVNPYTITVESKKPLRIIKTKNICPIPEPGLEIVIKNLDMQSFANLLRAYPTLYRKFNTVYWKNIIKKAYLMPMQFFDDPDLDFALNDPTMLAHWSKTRKILKLIKKHVEQNQKVVVFSSFTSFLNILNSIIVKKNLGEVFQLDGSTKDRDSLIENYIKTDKSILLSSYKVGGVGINLTSAEIVILAEPWWNSATEKQAICRLHRIGQDKSVTVYSINVEKSVELHILNIQNKKDINAKDYGVSLDSDKKYSRVKGSVTHEVMEQIVYGEYLE